MKKIISLLAALLTLIVADAQRISEQEALQKAQLFMQGKQITGHGPARKMNRAPRLPDNRAYYIFNVENNGGFVIVSGDSRMTDILGYSEHGSLDLATAPANVRWWLSQYEKAANNLPEQPLMASPRRAEETKAEITPFVTTTWGQGYPYNTQCPKIDGTNCATGCLATAMAQVMNYTNCPETKTGEIAAYTTKTNNLSLPKLDATTFPWDNMTDDDIARLMRYCGQSVCMDYGISESSAYDVHIPGALVGKFSYDKAVRLVYRNGYNSETWENMIYAELQAGRPVIYGGQSNTGGHSFILHGYQNGCFYINWGWDGNYDGYFELSALNPMYDNDRIYGRDQTAIIGIQKSKGGDAVNMPKVTVTKLELTSETSATRTSSSDNFTGISLEATLMNSFADEQTTLIGYALYLGNEQKQVISSENASFTPATALTAISALSFGSALADGTYRIVPIYREDETKAWTADEGSNYRYVEATITGNSLELKRMPDAAHDERLAYEIIDENHVSVAPANEFIEGDIVIPPAVVINDQEYIVSEFAFRGFEGCCFITSISLPATMNMNQYGVFDGCENLNSISVEPGNSLLYSEDGVLFFKYPYYENGVILYCFPAGKRGETYEVSSDVIDIGDWAFSGNNYLKSISLPSTITYIGQYAFANCISLESVNLPEGLYSISYNAFMGSSLKEVVLPQSLSTLSGNAFADCLALTAITSKHAIPLNISEDTFSPSTYDNATLYIPKGRLSYYQAANGWRMFSNIVEKEFEDVVISDDPFDNINGKQMILGFYAEDSGSRPFGGRTPGMYKAAVKFDKSRISPFKGNQITYVRFAIADANISNVKLWISSSLNDEYLYSQVITNVKVGWNVIKLDSPFDITGDSICIGYEFVQSNAGYPISATWGNNVENNAEGAGYIFGPYEADGSSSWDYIYYMNDSKAAVCLQAIVEGDLLPAYDMRPIELHALRHCYGEGRVDGWVWANVKNCGKEVISDAVIGFQIDERTPSFVNYNKGLSSQAFDEGGVIQFSFGNDIKAGRHQAKVFISEIDGKKPFYTQDDTLSLSFVVVGDTLPKQKYLYEHFTATWCPYSANSLYDILDVATAKRDDISLVRIHIDDELSCNECSELGIMQAFLPAYSIDRGAYVGDTYVAGAQGLFSDFPENEYVKGIPAVADLNIEVEYSQNDLVTIKISGRRTADYNLVGEKACLSVMLTEDGLQSIQASDNGYIEDFYNNHVLRTCLSDVWGDAIEWDGDKFLKTYTFRLNNKWKRENMHVIAFLANPFSGHNYDELHVINCNDFDLKDAAYVESPVILGDVTGSGTVDVQDATLVVNYILGNVTDEYDYAAADMNNDGEVDVFDVTAIINVILGSSRYAASSRRSEERDGNIQESVSLMSEENNVLMGIDNAARFTSFQFDVKVPKGVELTGVDWNVNTDTHMLKFAKTGEDCYRVVALSMESASLLDWSDTLLKLQLSNKATGEVVFNNILFVTPQGDTVHIVSSSLNLATGIQDVVHSQNSVVYDLTGRHLNMKSRRLPKGVYIVNNKKVVIK